MSAAVPPPLQAPPARVRPSRAALVVAGTVLLVVAALYLRENGPGSMPLGCVLNQTTGIHCPGCGMTRAAHATLHGDLPAAFRLNPVGMVVLPLALFALGLEILGWVRGRLLPWRLRISGRGGVMLAVLVIAFGVLRNFPWWPFTLLAPQ